MVDLRRQFARRIINCTGRSTGALRSAPVSKAKTGKSLSCVGKLDSGSEAENIIRTHCVVIRAHCGWLIVEAHCEDSLWFET